MVVENGGLRSAMTMLAASVSANTQAQNATARNLASLQGSFDTLRKTWCEEHQKRLTVLEDGGTLHRLEVARVVGKAAGIAIAFGAIVQVLSVILLLRQLKG